MRKEVSKVFSGSFMVFLLVGLFLPLPMGWAQGLGTAFVYQGHLVEGGSPATGTFDFEMALYDDGTAGAQVGSTLVLEDLQVTGGLFTATLDFGAVFGGSATWLQISVRPGSSTDAFTVLTPRQELTPTPNALYSGFAESSAWSGISGIPADLADGDDDTTYTAGSGLDLASGTFSLSGSFQLPQGCQQTELAVWDGVQGAWICGNLDTIGGGDITAVTAGTGLTGGGASGGVTLDVDFAGAGSAATVSRSDHTHGGSDITSGTVAESYIDPAVARDSEILSTVLAGDGSGSTLDADLLDGLDSADFMAAAADNWVDVTGDSMTGALSVAVSSTAQAIGGVNAATSGAAPGVYGETASTSGKGVSGLASSGVGFTAGVRGEAVSPDGKGVLGMASSTTGSPSGVFGRADSTAGRGVYGWASATAGSSIGVYGVTDSTSGRGLYGLATATTGSPTGALGLVDAPSGHGVLGTNNAIIGEARGVMGRSDSTSGKAVYGWATSATGGSIGVYGVSLSTDGRGVYGDSQVTTGTTYGVLGRNFAPAGAGVFGNSISTTGSAAGVRAESASAAGYGVRAVNSAATGMAVGVYGETGSTDGWAIYGMVPATSGAGYAVYGESFAPNGRAVFGWNMATTGDAVGVYGQTASTQGKGVIGQATSTTGGSVGVWGQSLSSGGYGVFGSAAATTGSSTGVWGQTAAPSGRGVYGNATSTTGGNVGVLGKSSSPAGWGVYGRATAASGNAEGVTGETAAPSGSGVRGMATTTTGAAYGVFGESSSSIGRAVFGWNYATTGESIGVYGQTGSPFGRAVVGVNTATTDTGSGVWGVTSSSTGGMAIWGLANVAGGYAGWFDGDVTVIGNVSKSGGSFKIDHPLDPANKYLLHSFVESPDMMNVYNGNVVLDGAGEAWIELPDWFEALNRDFRYQITPLGGPAPDLHVAEKITENRFRIAGGEPGLEVSWQVTGIRRDPWAEAHRIPVEEEKSTKEKGSYLHPELYGEPEERSLRWRRNPGVSEILRPSLEVSGEGKGGRP